MKHTRRDLLKAAGQIVAVSSLGAWDLFDSTKSVLVQAQPSAAPAPLDTAPQALPWPLPQQLDASPSDVPWLGALQRRLQAGEALRNPRLTPELVTPLSWPWFETVRMEGFWSTVWTSYPEKAPITRPTWVFRPVPDDVRLKGGYWNLLDASGCATDLCFPEPPHAGRVFSALCSGQAMAWRHRVSDGRTAWNVIDMPGETPTSGVWLTDAFYTRWVGRCGQPVWHYQPEGYWQVQHRIAFECDDQQHMILLTNQAQPTIPETVRPARSVASLSIRFLTL